MGRLPRRARRIGGLSRERSGVCPDCGRPLDAKEHDLRFLLPEAVLALPDREAAAGVWMSHDTPEASVLMEVPELGAFLRALLPVRLTEGFSLTLCVWVAIESADAKRAETVWWEPEYVDLALTGRLANRIEPWGLLGAPVELRAVNVDELPVCINSPDPGLFAVLNVEWDHKPILAAFPV